METGREVLYLSQEDVKKVNMGMKEYIDILEDAHIKKSRKEVDMPVKYNMWPNDSTFLCAMPCTIMGTGAAGLKWLAGCATNQERNLPRFMGFVILNDPESGAPVAIMDCTYITGMRTAGVSGVALRHLANPGSRTVGVLGCGLEGRTNLLAALTVCPDIRQVYAWGPRASTVDRYVEEMEAEYRISIKRAQCPEEAVREADVLLCSAPITHTDEFKVIEKDWLKPGVTAVPVNLESHFKPEAVLAFDKLFIDDTDLYHGAVKKGHFKELTRIPPELGELLDHKVPGRERPEEKIITFTEGIGLNDVAVAYRIWQLALEKGIGTLLPL
ncbi:ornithine cyclodeaminase family protein [Anaerolentibacter hominis]|uniref:ornithine cyclodeaminase family protein n=1 Tax=Anaerolentibacter hominis TaxID=3079009 RepID=UPI0031B8253D